MRHFKAQDEYEKEFEKIMDKLTYNRMKWEVWADLITMMATSISNALDPDSARRQRREKEYQGCLKRCGGVELPAKAFGVVVDALEANPDQDFLGSLYMRFELGSHWHGQFFTPYNICQLMAKTVNFSDLPITANEPTCGAGGNIIALAEAMRDAGINYQHNLFVVCQDIDIKAVYMAFVQMSLYGIPAIVYQSDTLLDPNGLKSTTGKMYTIGYMMAPELWKYSHKPSDKKIVLPEREHQEEQSDEMYVQMNLDEFLKGE
jgi:type I restriction-modification system DNA methylase subunit